jgi:hypothetical protein
MAIVPSLGRMIHEPFGDEGLKIAESREIIDLMNNAPIGDSPGVIVMGPLDRAQQVATDVLLKSIEEFNDQIVRPVLWAFDEAEVSSTIRSRCLRRWCPGSEEVDEEALEAARGLVESALANDVPGVIEGLKEQTPRDVLVAAATALRDRGVDDETRGLWEAVRGALRLRNPTPTEALAAFL